MFVIVYKLCSKKNERAEYLFNLASTYRVLDTPNRPIKIKINKHFKIVFDLLSFKNLVNSQIQDKQFEMCYQYFIQNCS
jgi:hypothetical protein